MTIKQQSPTIKKKSSYSLNALKQMAVSQERHPVCKICLNNLQNWLKTFDPTFDNTEHRKQTDQTETGSKSIKKYIKNTNKTHANGQNIQTYQVLVKSKESNLAWTVEQISEACESIVHIHVQQQNSSNKRHTLHLHSQHQLNKYHKTMP